MSELHTTTVEMPVRHRFQIDNTIQRGPGAPHRTIYGIDWSPGVGEPVYYAADVEGHTYTLPIARIDAEWRLVPPKRRVRVYTITVEADEEAPGERMADSWMKSCVSNGIFRQVGTHPNRRYSVTRCESTVEEREV